MRSCSPSSRGDPVGRWPSNASSSSAIAGAVIGVDRQRPRPVPPRPVPPGAPRQGRRADRRRRLHDRRARPVAAPRGAPRARDQRIGRGDGRHPRPRDHRPPDRRVQPPGAPVRAVHARSSARRATTDRCASPSSTSTISRLVNDNYGHEAATSSCAASPRSSPTTSAPATSSADTAARNSC